MASPLGWVRDFFIPRRPSDDEINRLAADYEDAQDRIRAQRRELVDLSNESEAFWNKIQTLEQEKLADSEKVRQQKDLLEQAREEASTTEQLHLEEINQLYNTINGLKTGYETLSDDEIIGQMRKLHHHLEAWVKTNFRNAQKLGMLMDQTDGEYPRSSHQRRALIQAFVTDMINTMIFAPYHLGMAKQWGDALATVEHAVQQRCSEDTTRNWRLGTSTALDFLTQTNGESTLSDIATCVEKRIAHCSSTESERRTRQLHNLLQKCADFKSSLSRLQDKYGFNCSLCGTDFQAGSMAFAGGEDPEELADEIVVVRFSVWPALVKYGPDGERRFLEPELVWTMIEEE